MGPQDRLRRKSKVRRNLGGRVLTLLSTGFNHSLLIFLLLLVVPDPRPKILLGHLVERFIVYVDDYVEDRDRVDRLAELLRGPSLTSAQIAEIEKHIGYNTVPLSLQK